jgi:hypothetical protein
MFIFLDSSPFALAPYWSGSGFGVFFKKFFEKNNLILKNTSRIGYLIQLFFFR